jgi:hypothetical protein
VCVCVSDAIDIHDIAPTTVVVVANEDAIWCCYYC